MSFSEIFRLHARHRPAKLAIAHGDMRYDFRDLDRAIDGMCHSLRSRGAGLGDIVGIALPDNSAHLIALLAVARIGAVILPMDCRWSQAEKEAVVQTFQAQHVLVEDDLTPAPNWHSVTEDWYAPTDEPYFDLRVDRDTPLILSLSSGTTGQPKGPRLSHVQFENRFMAYWINMGINAHDIFVSATPLYFGGGRGFSLGTLMAGGTLHLYPPPYQPEELVAYVTTNSATALFLVPTLLRRVLTLEIDGLIFPTLRCLISSGAALFPAERTLIRSRMTPNLYEFYSSTEAGSVSVMGPDDVREGLDSVGRPCFRVQVEIVSDDHQLLPAGEIGRLRYRSPASPSGYFMGDEGDAFHEGWFYPGDLAMLDEQGYLFLRGRKKDMIIRGGVNIYPADVEKVLLADERVVDVAVVGVPAVDLGEEVAAYVVCKVPVSDQELQAICRAQLAPYKVPRVFRFVDALPKNAGGKTLKKQLTDSYIAESR